MSSRAARLAIPVALAAAGATLVGCGSSSDTERDFDAWIQDNPVPGAALETRSATDSIFGRNEIFATYRLTATPSKSSILAAQKGACGFNEHTKAMPTYTLLVDAVSLQIACIPDNQPKVAAFWQAVHALPIDSLAQDKSSVTVTSPTAREAVQADVLGKVYAAATKDDLIPDGSYDLNAGDFSVSLYSGTGAQQARVGIAAANKVFQVSAGAVRSVRIDTGAVLADSAATVADARSWEDAVNDSASGSGRPVIAVNSAKTQWSRLAPNLALRNLVDQVAARDDVARVSVQATAWVVTGQSLADSRRLARQLQADRSTGLGALYVSAERSDNAPCTAQVADVGVADTLLSICGVNGAGVATTSHTGTTIPEVALADDSDATLSAVLAKLRQLPDQTLVAVRSQAAAPYPSVTITVGEPTVTPDTDSAKDYAKRVAKLWAATG